MQPRLKNDSKVSGLGEAKNAAITARNGTERERERERSGLQDERGILIWARSAMVHTTQEVLAGGGGQFRCLQTGRTHFWGDILMIAFGSHSYHGSTDMPFT